MDVAAFERLAKKLHDDAGAEVLPVVRRIRTLPGVRGLPAAITAQAAGGSAFVLESATVETTKDGESAPSRNGWEEDGTALIGWNPRATWRAWGHRVEWAEGGRLTVREEDRPLDSLFRLVGRRPHLPGLPRFSGGLVGYLGWGAVRWFEPRVPARLGPDPSFPDAEFMLVDDLCALHAGRGEATLIANVEVSHFGSARAAFAASQERLDALEESVVRGVAHARDAGDRRNVGAEAGTPASLEVETRTAASEARDAWGQEGFEAAVRAVLRHVRAGDCMQTVLSRRLVARYDGEPLALYERLRSASPVPYHFCIGFADAPAKSSTRPSPRPPAEGPYGSRRAVIGASPELLVRVEDGHVTVRPIAGTRPRGATAAEDAAFEAELRADPKELAEHVMLVDLGRNDVGRVASPGSVRVEEREVVERFSHVMHLVSQVGGTLRTGLTPRDALEAAFPAGTVSGAPKVRAMEIIDALEPVPRGPYGGAVGTLCYDGSIVMAIHLRSVALAGQELRLQAGAGLVSESVPSREFAETEAKLAAVRAGLSGPTSRSDSERWRRW